MTIRPTHNTPESFSRTEQSQALIDAQNVPQVNVASSANCELHISEKNELSDYCDMQLKYLNEFDKNIILKRKYEMILTKVNELLQELK